MNVTSVPDLFCMLHVIVNEMESLQEKNFYHGLLDNREAESRLNGSREQSYLLRQNVNNVLIISYNKKETTKHVTLPTNKNNIIRKNNTNLKSPESLFDYVLEKTHLTTLTYPVLRDNFPSNLDYVQHDIESCDICGERVGQNKLLKHKEKAHRISECSTCKTILFPYTSTTHKKICTPGSVRKLKCNFCNYTTDSSNYLRRHEDNHTRKNVSCSFCDQTFQTQDKLTKHMKYNHSKAANLNCDHCEKTFSTPSGLRKHIKNIHIFVNDQPMFRCTVCEQTFESSARHKKHMSCHKLNKEIPPFICVRCGGEFKSYASKKVHMKRNKCTTEKVIPPEVMKSMKKAVRVSNNKLDKLVVPVRNFNGNTKICPNFRKELSQHSNSFNKEVDSEIVEDYDEDGDIARPSVISYLKDPIQVITRVIQKRGVRDPLLVVSIDKGLYKVHQSKSV